MCVNTKGTETGKLPFVTSVIKPDLTGDNRGFTSYLGTFFVYYLRLNTTNIVITIPLFVSWSAVMPHRPQFVVTEADLIGDF